MTPATHSRLRMTDAIAGIANSPIAFITPMNCAMTQMNARYGSSSAV
jgi:hypothetical protein